jgi:hypothetical protein
MTTPATAGVTDIATAWAVLHAALHQRRAVRARYHDHLRVLCPHALGWKNGRPKALVYQTAIIAIIATTTTHDPRGWRSLFVDEIYDAVITDDCWHTADNYTPNTTGIDVLSVAIR